MDKNGPMIISLLWLAFVVTLVAFIWNITLFFKHKKVTLPDGRNGEVSLGAPKKSISIKTKE
jgi:hypothetical protein